MSNQQTTNDNNVLFQYLYKDADNFDMEVAVVQTDLKNELERKPTNFSNVERYFVQIEKKLDSWNAYHSSILSQFANDDSDDATKARIEKYSIAIADYKEEFKKYKKLYKNSKDLWDSRTRKLTEAYEDYEIAVKNLKSKYAISEETILREDVLSRKKYNQMAELGAEAEILQDENLKIQKMVDSVVSNIAAEGNFYMMKEELRRQYVWLGGLTEKIVDGMAASDERKSGYAKIYIILGVLIFISLGMVGEVFSSRINERRQEKRAAAELEELANEFGIEELMTIKHYEPIEGQTTVDFGRKPYTEETNTEISIDDIQIITEGEDKKVEYLITTPTAVIKVAEKLATIRDESALLLDSIQIMELEVSDHWYTREWAVFENIEISIHEYDETTGKFSGVINGETEITGTIDKQDALLTFQPLESENIYRFKYDLTTFEFVLTENTGPGVKGARLILSE